MFICFITTKLGPEKFIWNTWILWSRNDDKHHKTHVMLVVGRDGQMTVNYKLIKYMLFGYKIELPIGISVRET